MSVELKPCPFCGGTDIHSYAHCDFFVDWYNWKVCCGNCSAQIHRGTQQKAEEAWNRRAE